MSTGREEIREGASAVQTRNTFTSWCSCQANTGATHCFRDHRQTVPYQHRTVVKRSAQSLVYVQYRDNPSTNSNLRVGPGKQTTFFKFNTLY